MSRRTQNATKGGNPGQQPNQGFVAKIVTTVLLAVAKWFNDNQPDGKQIDGKYGVGLVRNTVLGVPVVQVTGPLNNVIAYLNHHFRDRKGQIVSFGAKMWSAKPFVHAVVIDASSSQAGTLRQTIAKAFANATFLQQFAYYNLVGATDVGTYVINGMAQLGTAVNEGKQITQAFLNCVFNANSNIRGTKSTTLIMYGPDEQRTNFALNGNLAVTLPDMIFDTKENPVSNNMAGTRAFVTVRRGTNELYYLTAADIFTLLEGGEDAAKVEWKLEKLQTTNGIEDISQAVVVDGIAIPRLIATMTEGPQSHARIDIALDGDQVTFAFNTEATAATDATKKVGPVQTCDTRLGVQTADHNGSPEAVSWRAFRSLPVEIQALATGGIDIDAATEAQQAGLGISTLLDMPLPTPTYATSPKRRTRRQSADAALS